MDACDGSLKIAARVSSSAGMPPPTRSSMRAVSRSHARRSGYAPRVWTDRKSTRLNSSHLGISYAVFCLKKKTHRVQKVGVYVYCPHCSDRLRMSSKYLGVKVACKACSGRLMAVE